jgi:hypothetical protein
MSEEIDMGDGKTVKLMTCWQFLGGADWDDFYAPRLQPDQPELVAKVEEHRACRSVMVLYSAFGWREIRCRAEAHGEAGVVLWTHPDRQEA